MPLKLIKSSTIFLIAFVFCGCTTTQSPSLSKAAGEQGSVHVRRDDVGLLSEEQTDFSKALAYYVAGMVDLSNGESEGALKNWEQVVKLDPSRAELRERIVQEFFRRNEFKKAAEILEVATRQNPDSFSYWTLLAVAYRSDKQWEMAVKTAEKAIRLDSSKFSPYQVLFEVAIESHDPKRAKKILDRAARRKSDDFHFWVQLADLSLALSAKEPTLGINREDILRYYDKAIALQPNEAGVLARVADFYVVNRNFTKAVELYQKILRQQPNAENIRLKLALTHVAQGESKQAVETLKQIVKDEPFRYQVFSLIGELYEDMGDVTQALANYQLSLSANPNQMEPYLKMVLLQIRNKHPEEAIKLLDSIREKFPNVPQMSYFYGLAYYVAKDFAHAVPFMEDAYRLAQVSSPDMLNEDFYFYYGAVLERNGQFDKAVEQFNKALEIDPDYAAVYNYLGFMYADKNIKLDEAEQLIEKALAYEPQNGAFLDSMGWVYYRRGKFNKALEYLQQAIKTLGNDSIVCDHLGDVYFQMGKQAEALQYYQKSVELDPSHKEISIKLEKVKSTLSATEAVSHSETPASR